jgi:flagellar biosynthesis/type III secretory pathway protein FliH
MMRQDAIDQSALWLADGLSRAADDKSSRLALDRIRRGIEAGTTTLDQTVQELSGGQKAQPGEFGLELAGAALVTFLLTTMQEFFKTYIKKLTEDAANKGVQITLEEVKKLFRKDAEDHPDRLGGQLAQALEKYGKEAGIDPDSAQRLLKLVKDESALKTVAKAD